MASTVSKFTDNEIEVKVLVKSSQPQWNQVQLRLAWSDGSEMACVAYDKAVASMDKLEIDRIYNMTVPGSCVKAVKDTRKAGMNSAQDIRINKPIRWSLSKARWETKVELHPIEISAAQEQEVGDVFDIVGYVLEQEEPDPTATIQKRKIVVGAVSDSCLNTIPLELLGRSATLACTVGACIGAKGVTLSEWKGERKVSTKHLSWVVFDPASSIVSRPTRPSIESPSPMKKCLPMVSGESISVEMLQKEMEQMREEFERFKASDMKAKCPTEKRCEVEITFDSVDISLFDKNVVLKTSPPMLLLLGSMSDKTGSLSPVKIWTTALCVLLKCTPSAFVARWKKMGVEAEKKSLVSDLNTAFESQWECAVGITLWEKNDRSVEPQVNVNNCVALVTSNE
jgi:hypothetical protein